MSAATRRIEQARLAEFQAELTPLEEGRCPLESLPKDEHFAQHPFYADCATRIVADLKELQQRIRSASWTPKSIEADRARGTRSRIDAWIKIFVQDHEARA